MGVSHRFRGALAVLAMSSFFLGGCQGMKATEHKRLIEHQALIDFSGL